MQLIEFLILAICAVCWIHGVVYATSEDQVLVGVANWLEKKLGEELIKPLFDCPYCMSSIHGAFVYLVSLAIGLHSLPILGVVLFIPVCCGIQVLYFNSYE